MVYLSASSRRALAICLTVALFSVLMSVSLAVFHSAIVQNTFAGLEVRADYIEAHLRSGDKDCLYVPFQAFNTYESYLVGEDYKIATGSLFIPDAVGALTIDTPSARRAFAGQRGHHVTHDYRDVKVISVYRNVTYDGMVFGLILDVDLGEATAQMRNAYILSAVTILLSLLASIRFTRPRPESLEDRIRALGTIDGAAGQAFLFEKAFNDHPDGLCICKEDGTIYKVSYRMAKMFGYKREELIGEPVTIFVDGARKDAHDEHFEDFKSGRVRSTNTSVKGVAKTGDIVPVSLGISRLVIAKDVFLMACIRRENQDPSEGGTLG